RGELQATLVAVAGVDGPVAAGLALREGVPHGAAGDGGCARGGLGAAGDTGGGRRGDLVLGDGLAGGLDPVDGRDAGGDLPGARGAGLEDGLGALGGLRVVDVLGRGLEGL